MEEGTEEKKKHADYLLDSFSEPTDLEVSFKLRKYTFGDTEIFLIPWEEWKIIPQGLGRNYFFERRKKEKK